MVYRQQRPAQNLNCRAQKQTIESIRTILTST